MSDSRRESRIAVTGSSGFVGTWLMRSLSERISERNGTIIPLLDRRRSDSVDIRNPLSVSAEVARARPTAVIHLAAIAAPREAEADPGLAWEVNVLGTLNLAQAVMRHAPEARFVFVGSSEVYGLRFNASSAPVTEAEPFEPTSAYGATKAAADIMLGQMALKGLRSVRFRPFNHTGPEQAPIYVVSDFARQIAGIEAGRSEAVIRVGNLRAERDFLDVRDVVQAYADAALTETPLEPGTAMNLATGQPRSIAAVLDMLRDMAKVPIKVEADKSRFRSNDVSRASGDPSRAETLLGWRPLRPLEETLREVLTYWRSQYE